MSAESSQSGVKVLADNDDYPEPVKAAEPEVRTLCLPNIVCERLVPKLVTTFDFNHNSDVTNWDRQHDPRPTEKYSYLSNLHRQLMNGRGSEYVKLNLSWIQAMDLQFVLRENFAKRWDDPSHDVPAYDDYHMRAADKSLSDFQKTFDLKA